MTDDDLPTTIEEALGRAMRRAEQALSAFYGPDWYKPRRVSLASLDMGHSRLCLVGQLERKRLPGDDYADYSEGMQAMEDAGVITREERANPVRLAVDAGYLPLADGRDHGVGNRDQQRAWVARIRALRAAAKTAREV